MAEVEATVGMTHAQLIVVRVEPAVEAQSALSGPAQRAASHQLAQAISNQEQK